MFHDVNNIDDRIRLMKSVSRLRSEVRENLLKERMGDITVQEDLENLFKPITKELVKEKQMFEAIVKGKGKSVPIPALDYVNPERSAESPIELETTKKEQLKGIKLDPDSTLTDKHREILALCDLPLPSKVIEKDMDIKDLLKNVDKVMDAQSLGGLKARKKNDRKTGHPPADVLNTRQTYVKVLTDINTARGYSGSGDKQGTSATKPSTSSGDAIKGGNGLKVQNGKFGDLTIHEDKLKLGKLEVYKGNKKVLSKRISKDLFDLLTKRFNKQRKYSNDSIATFNKLLELSGISTMTAKSQKANLKAIYYHDPNELIDRLEKLISAKSAGNTGVDNEINTILDKLLEIGQITPIEYRKVYRNIFG
jgi:hypothetical protein